MILDERVIVVIGGDDNYRNEMDFFCFVGFEGRFFFSLKKNLWMELRGLFFFGI